MFFPGFGAASSSFMTDASRGAAILAAFENSVIPMSSAVVPKQRAVQNYISLLFFNNRSFGPVLKVFQTRARYRLVFKATLEGPVGRTLGGTDHHLDPVSFGLTF